MVAPSFVIVTSPISSTSILSKPTGPTSDMRGYYILYYTTQKKGWKENRIGE